jgi:hypothetical protein
MDYKLTSFETTIFNSTQNTNTLYDEDITEDEGETNMDYKVMTTEVTFFHSTQNPLYGEGVTKLRLEDEGAGIFFTLMQDDDNIRMDEEEFILILEHMKLLKKQYENNVKE